MTERTRIADNVNLHAAAREMAGVLAHLGFLPDDGLANTPMRVVRALLEMTDGYTESGINVLQTQFDSENYGSEFIVLRDVEFASLCEHHLLPFTGVAHVGYVPSGRIVGLSKLARLVDIHARRLQNQERLTRSVADDIHAALEPRAVAVMAIAHHGCMGCRGARKSGARMVTAASHGDRWRDFLEALKVSA